MSEKSYYSPEKEPVRPQPQPKKAAIVFMPSAVEERAKDVAQERLAEDRETLVGPRFFHGENRTSEEQLRGVQNIIKKIWKYNLFDAYYREKEIQKAKQNIKESGGNLYVAEGKGLESHNRAMSAVANRFSYELLHTEAGEERIKLDSATKENVQKDLRELFSRYMSGLVTDDAFEEEKTRIINNIVAATGIKRGSTPPLFADNLLDVARNMRANVEHGARCEQIDFDRDVIVGLARLGARTEAQYNSVDRIVDKIQKTKVGRLVNEATLASAVAIAYSVTAGVSKRVATSKVAAWGTFGATAVLASGLAAARESKRMEDERKHHARTMAVGRTIHENSPRRQEMQKAVYEMRGAQDLLDDLSGALSDASGNLKWDFTRSEIDRVVSILAEINARTRLSDAQSVDLIRYSDIDRVEEERIALDVARYMAQRHVQACADKNSKDGAMTIAKELSEREALITKSLIEGDKGMQEKDRIFGKMKRRHVAKMAVATFLSGIAIGTVAQETAAAFGSGKEGIFEGLSGKAPEHVVGTQHMTSLEYVRRLLTHDLPKMEGGHTHVITIGDHRYVLPEGVELAKNAEGGFDMIRDGHDVLVHNMRPDDAGMFSADDVNLLHHANVGLHDGGATVVSEVHENGAIEAVREHGASIKRNIWYDNDTPHTFDHNELKLWWGGAHNTGLDEHGNYVFNVAHMTSDGSYHAGLNVDARQLILDGKMKMLFSVSSDMQNHVFELPIQPDGTVTIDPHSEIGRALFSMSDGHAHFLGRFAEVAQVVGKHDGAESVNILATYEGKGIQEMVPTSHTFHTNIFDVPADYRVDPPPFIPLVPRDPLEKSGPPTPTPPVIPPRPTPYSIPYEGYGSCGFGPLSEGTAEKLRRDRMSPRLQENPGADLNPAEEYAWYRSSWNGEYKEKVETLVDDFGTMDKKCDVSVCIPVAAHQEGKNIRRTLDQYVHQTLNPDLFELVIFANQPDVDNHGNPVEPDDTFKEIVAFAKDHPEINLRVAHRKLSAAEAVMGNIRKLMTDAVVERAARAGNKRIVIVSNDADCVGMSPDYLKNFREKLLPEKTKERKEEKVPQKREGDVEISKPDAVMGQLDWDPVLRKKNPVLFSVIRFGQFLDAQGRRETGFVGSSGANFAFCSDIYAATGGYESSERLGEDVSLGTFIRAARYGHPERGIHFAGARASRLYTSARRGIDAIKKGFLFEDMWSKLPFTASDELRKGGDNVIPEHVFDFSSKGQKKKFIRELERAINLRLSSKDTLYNPTLYQRRGSIGRALKWLGVTYVFAPGRGVHITNADRLIRLLSEEDRVARKAVSV